MLLCFWVVISGSQCFGLLGHSKVVHLIGKSRRCFQMAIKLRTQCDVNGCSKKSVHVSFVSNGYSSWLLGFLIIFLGNWILTNQTDLNGGIKRVNYTQFESSFSTWITCTFGLSLHRIPVPFSSAPIRTLHFCCIWTEFIVDETNQCFFDEWTFVSAWWIFCEIGWLDLFFAWTRYCHMLWNSRNRPSTCWSTPNYDLSQTRLGKYPDEYYERMCFCALMSTKHNKCPRHSQRPMLSIIRQILFLHFKIAFVLLTGFFSSLRLLQARPPHPTSRSHRSPPVLIQPSLLSIRIGNRMWTVCAVVVHDRTRSGYVWFAARWVLAAERSLSQFGFSFFYKTRFHLIKLWFLGLKARLHVFARWVHG